MAPRVAPWLTTLLVLAAFGPMDAAAGYGAAYWEDAGVEVDAFLQLPAAQAPASHDCQPIEGTGERPALEVYPVLNMVVINQCFLGATGSLLEGPVVLAGGLGHGKGMPSNVTIKSEDGSSWTVDAMVCLPPPGAKDPPRVVAYPALGVLYDLVRCRLVSADGAWDAFTVVLTIDTGLPGL